MKDDILMITLGAVLGAAFVMAMLALPPATLRTSNNLMHECEKSLPRNQECELFARPMEVE